MFRSWEPMFVLPVSVPPVFDELPFATTICAPAAMTAVFSPVRVVKPAPLMSAAPMPRALHKVLGVDFFKSLEVPVIQVIEKRSPRHRLVLLLQFSSCGIARYQEEAHSNTQDDCTGPLRTIAPPKRLFASFQQSLALHGQIVQVRTGTLFDPVKCVATERRSRIQKISVYDIRRCS